MEYLGGGSALDLVRILIPLTLQIMVHTVTLVFTKMYHLKQ